MRVAVYSLFFLLFRHLFGLKIDWPIGCVYSIYYSKPFSLLLPFVSPFLVVLLKALEHIDLLEFMWMPLSNTDEPIFNSLFYILSDSMLIKMKEFHPICLNTCKSYKIFILKQTFKVSLVRSIHSYCLR